MERLERCMARVRGPDPHDAIQPLALRSLSTEDLMVLADVIVQGRRECQWTERESAAVKALTCAFEQKVRRIGYRSMAGFQRRGYRLPNAFEAETGQRQRRWPPGISLGGERLESTIAPLGSGVPAQARASTQPTFEPCGMTSIVCG